MNNAIIIAGDDGILLSLDVIPSWSFLLSKGGMPM